MIEKAARDLLDPLNSCAAPLKVPMAPDLKKGWKPTHLFRGATGILTYLSCHASVLVPGHSPHPPHTHHVEEILLMLAGEADLILPDSQSTGDHRRHRLTAGQFAYYPSGFPHTIEAAGERPANYLMLQWEAPPTGFGHPLSFGVHDPGTTAGGKKWGRGFQTTPVIDSPTGSLRKLEAHLTRLQPGGGYPPHTDRHDVVIVILEGKVETLGQRIGPFGAIFYRGGTPHGMANAGTTTARYLVFEFHGPRVPLAERKPVNVLIQAARRILPSRFRMVLARSMERVLHRLKRKP